MTRPDFWLLLGSSTGLYLGGMVWNDIFDAGLDAVERPERPIPSGRISRRSAQVLGGILMVGGLAAAAAVGMSSFVIAIAITVLVVLYDAVLKSTVCGPLGMAGCRFLNILLGASAGNILSEVFSGPQLLIASGLGVYILGVTWFARNEAGTSHRGALIAAALVAVGGLAIPLTGMLMADPVPGGIQGALIAYGLIIVHLLLRAALAVQDPKPRNVQRMVGLFLLTVIFIDAVSAFAWTGDSQKATVIVMLVLPARLLRRVIPMT